MSCPLLLLGLQPCYWMAVHHYFNKGGKRKKSQGLVREEWEDQLQEIAAAKKAWPKDKGVKAGVFMYV
jgi:hypothetical protein